MPPPLVRPLPVCCLFGYGFVRVRQIPRLMLTHHTKKIIKAVGPLRNILKLLSNKLSKLWRNIYHSSKGAFKYYISSFRGGGHELTLATYLLIIFQKDKNFHTAVRIFLCIIWKEGSKFLFAAWKLKWKKVSVKCLKTIWLKTFDRQSAGK